MTTRSLLLLIGLSLMALIINIDYTAVNLALLSIAHDLHTNLNVVQWVLSGYILAWAAIVIPASKCSAVFGQRRVCQFSLILFALSSLTAGLAVAPWMIIVSRIVQGMSAAVFFPTLYTFLFTYFPEEKRGFAVGIFSLGVGTGAAIGPTFGGMLLTHFGWSWIFFINLPITAVAMMLILHATDRDQPTEPEQKIVTPNALLLASGLVGLMYSISVLHQPIAHTALFYGIIFITLSALIGYWFREKNSANQLVPWSLFNNRSYLGTTLGIGLEQFSFSASFVSIGIFMQNIVHYSIYQASIIFLALSVIFAVISTMGGIIVDKIGVRKPAMLGFLLMAIGALCFTFLGGSATATQLISVLFILGIGMGFAFAALNTGVITTVHADEISIASSVFMLFALFGNSLGVILTTLCYESIGLNMAMDIAGGAALCGLIAVAVLVQERRGAAVGSTELNQS